MSCTCSCKIQAICLEVKKPGINRGRWYWRCATGSCNFFKWDNSPYNFITHPTEAYAAIEPYGGVSRRPPSIPFTYSKTQSNVLPKTNVKIVFLVLSDSHIGLKIQKNLTLEPVISRIQNIQWNEELNMWILPATVIDYKNALRSIPTDLPNLQIDIDPIPDFLLENIVAVPREMVTNPNVVSEMELKFVEFVESPVYSKLADFQKEGVRLGIERRGRILYGNETGLGVWEQSLALASVYQDEWPALIMCDKSMCATWKNMLISFLEINEDEICIIDDMNGPLFKDDVTIAKKRKTALPKKVKTEPTKPLKRRKVYAERTRNLRENGYDSDSSSSSSSDSQVPENDDSIEETYTATNTENIKFYISSHKKVSNNRSKIMEQGFRVMICDGSHYLKNKDQNQAKNIRKLLESQPRAILISDTALYTLPIDLYTQIAIVKKEWAIKYELFVQRYCNPRNTVFGMSVNGKSNTEELQYILDDYAWYAPKLDIMKPELSDVTHHPIFLQTDKKERREMLPHVQALKSGLYDFEDYIADNDLLYKNNVYKKKPLLEYLEYVFETYRRPKIAYLYLDKENAKTLTDLMTKKKMKFTHIDDLEHLDEKVADYNVSHSVQGVLLDMNLKYPEVNFAPVDLVIIMDLPHTQDKWDTIETLFASPERTTPLLIKYLILTDSVDDYLWSELQIS